MDPYWRDRAKCDTGSAHLFDPVDTDDRGDGGAARFKLARTLCNACPVAAACYSAGKADRVDGLRAGVYLINGKPSADPRPQHRRSRLDQLRGAA